MRYVKIGTEGKSRRRVVHCSSAAAAAVIVEFLERIYRYLRRTVAFCVVPIPFCARGFTLAGYFFTVLMKTVFFCCRRRRR